MQTAEEMNAAMDVPGVDRAFATNRVQVARVTVRGAEPRARGGLMRRWRGRLSQRHPGPW